MKKNASLRGAVSEQEALKEIYKLIRKEQKAADCSRAIMVAFPYVGVHKSEQTWGWRPVARFEKKTNTVCYLNVSLLHLVPQCPNTLSG